MTVLLDVDGVLADFSRPAFLRHGITVGELELMPRGVYSMEKMIGCSRKDFWAKIDNYSFWANLPLYTGAITFVRKLVERWPVCLCTRLSPNAGDCAAGKACWIDRHFPGIQVIYVTNGVPKKLLARPGAVLIDDHQQSVDEFIAAGGYGILVPMPWNTTDRSAIYSGPNYNMILRKMEEFDR